MEEIIEIKTKVCSKCGVEKSISEFPKRSSSKDGHRAECFICKRKMYKEYRDANAEKVYEAGRKWRENNKEKHKADMTRWYQENREYAIECSHKRFKEKHDEIREQGREYYQKNKEARLQNTREWVKNNPDKVKEMLRKYRESHREEITNNAREYLRYKRANDLEFQILCTLRTTVSNNLKKNDRQRTLDLIGCSVDYFKKYLESLFVDGMSWENRGKNGWSLDHCRPASSFNLFDVNQQKECFHYSNLQPLWRMDNIMKSNKWNSEYEYIFRKRQIGRFVSVLKGIKEE